MDADMKTGDLDKVMRDKRIESLKASYRDVKKRYEVAKTEALRTNRRGANLALSNLATSMQSVALELADEVCK